MKAFTLKTPRTLAQALELLAVPEVRGERGTRTKLLAGGQDLLTELKEHLVEPETLVDLKGIPGLASVQSDASGALEIGALTTLDALASALSSDVPEPARARLRILHEAVLSIASPQIRSVGTVGGNLCQRPRCWYYRSEHAKCLKKGGSECFSYGGLNKYNAIFGGGPSYIVHPSDLAPALCALDAEVTLLGPRGERRIALESFFTLPSEGSVLRENVLEPDEILTAVRVPAPPEGLRSTYLKFKERGSFDFALSSVALAVAVDGGRVRHARLVLGGVAPIPWRCKSAETLLVGKEHALASFEAAAVAALEGAEPLQHNGYKVPLTRGLILRAAQALT